MTLIEKTLSQLVSFKTTHEPGQKQEFGKLFKFVLAQLKSCNVTYKVVSSNGYKSLLIRKSPNKIFKWGKPKVVLMNHIDVVPGSAKLFKLRLKGKRLLGRGVIDMKYATAVGIELLKEIKNEKLDFGMILTSEEEIGGQDGAGYVVQKLGCRGEVFIVPDSGEGLNLEYAAKGVLHLKITARGKSAHGAYPWRGVNALDMLLKGYQSLRKVFPVQKKETWGATLNLGGLTGGQAVNQVCDQAEMLLDFRFPPGGKWHNHKILAKVKSLFPKCTVSILSQGEAFISKTNNPYLQSWREVTCQVTGRSPKLLRSFGATDARFVAPYNLPVIVSAPLGGDLHTEKEWLDRKSLFQFSQVLRQFVRKMA